MGELSGGEVEVISYFLKVTLNHSHSLLEIHQRWFRSHHCSSVSFLFWPLSPNTRLRRPTSERGQERISGRESNPTRAMKPVSHTQGQCFFFLFVCMTEKVTWLRHPHCLTGWFPEVLNSLSTWVLEGSKDFPTSGFLPLTHSTTTLSHILKQMSSLFFGFSSNRIQTLTGVPTLTHERWQSHYPEPSVLPTFIGLFGKSCHPSLILHIHYLISVNFCQVFSRHSLAISLRFSKVLGVISIKPSIAIIPKGRQNVKSKISLFR